MQISSGHRNTLQRVCAASSNQTLSWNLNSSKMKRNCRCRWSREKALEYLQQHLLTPADQLLIEVDRYIAMPGQACAYKIGEQKILELRSQAQDALGELTNTKWNYLKIRLLIAETVWISCREFLRYQRLSRGFVESWFFATSGAGEDRAREVHISCTAELGWEQGWQKQSIATNACCLHLRLCLASFHPVNSIFSTFW